MRPRKHKYFVTTYDGETKAWTPQRGVRTGPWSQFGLRRALRALRDTGYSITKSSGFMVRVQRDDER